MSKKTEIDELTEKLVDFGMDRGMALKNLCECDRNFIEKLYYILK